MSIFWLAAYSYFMLLIIIITESYRHLISSSILYRFIFNPHYRQCEKGAGCRAFIIHTTPYTTDAYQRILWRTGRRRHRFACRRLHSGRYISGGDYCVRREVAVINTLSGPSFSPRDWRFTARWNGGHYRQHLSVQSNMYVVVGYITQGTVRRLYQSYWPAHPRLSEVCRRSTT